MLSSIYIKNFAIIDEIEIDFHENMSVLTGETGAGKSILIDAINVVLGNKKTNKIIWIYLRVFESRFTAICVIT